MIIYLLIKNKLINLRLPKTASGNYWLSYKGENGQEINVINIESQDNAWVAKSNEEATIIYQGKPLQQTNLNIYTTYQLKLKNENAYMIAMPLQDNSFMKLSIKTESEITIGKSANNVISYNHELVAETHAKITKQNNAYVITGMNSNTVIYVNGNRINASYLKPGDIVFIFGLRIIFMGSFIVINNPNNQVKINSNAFVPYQDQIVMQEMAKEDNYIPLYKDDDYFEKAPRFITKFEPQDISIDAPPQKDESEDPPILLTIGPMLSMSLISIVMAYSSLSEAVRDASGIASAIPSLVVAGAMLLSVALWPSLTKRYETKKREQREKERQEKYQKYLQTKNEEIELLISKERQILNENNVSLEECQSIIMNKNRNLWEREIDHDDFLKIRLGIGTVKPSVTIRYPEEHFSLDSDNLKEILEKTVYKNKVIDNVPIAISLAEKNITAVVGDDNLTDAFLESVFLQVMTFHSYRDLKIVFLTNDDNRFTYLKTSPHLFSDDKEARFYGTNQDEIKQICNYIASVYNSRKYVEDNKINETDYKKYDTYYLIIIDDLKMVRNSAVIKEIMESPINYGFSLLIRSNNLTSLPNECSTFITIGGEEGKTSGYFENELISDKQQAFVADLNVRGRVNLPQCIRKIANIPIKSQGKLKMLPKSYGFLEMYDAGNIEQLNILHRWKENDPTISLQVPVGIDEVGELLKIDAHEKVHGPHGLIAGMTGSGKSEFIITYILSLAINYHPDEVSFVLIDYKGGGLAGAFENRETGISLPHLAGTITNLDTAEMNRALASIQSELRRRQQVFSEARDKLGESTLDIYKYQRLYREGKVETPISHLFVISDEFAELKQQQPEFMEQLISTARIGRSLGVHLILATQKPSGVVNDQIWSNSRFRICLKVQNKADSMDMIKMADAASLKDAGRFYLQVGYNEYFALGQSAYCGTPYFPQEKRQKKIDTNIDFIDNVGMVVKSISTEEEQKTKSQGEELGNVLNYIVNLAKEQNIKIPKLWLNKLPEKIFVDNLKQKYNYQPQRNDINPIIGEFDDPNNQRQGLLTLPLTKEGNTIIYGIAGSGKEELLTTIIYDTILEHSAEEVNFYIVDFGSEFLRVFEKAPQVGDFVTPADSEKIENLFKLINTFIEQRKEILADYNGNYNLYNEKNETPLPLITLIINNYEAFAELNDPLSDMLATITRECVKYGIVVILTTAGTNAVKLKISQNFKQLIPLQLADPYDYTNLVGKTNGLVPAPITGRGLIKLDGVFEFQTAYAHEPADISQFLKEFCEKLDSEATTRAIKIPVLPEKITLNTFDALEKSLTKLPIGIYKDNLEFVRYDFKNNYTTLVSGLSGDALKSFVSPLMEEFKKVENTNLIVFDALNDGLESQTVKIYNNKFDEVVEKIYEYSESIKKIYEKNDYELSTLEKYNTIVCIINGVENFFKRLKDETKTKFEQLMQDNEETKKIIFVIVDVVPSIKTQEYTTWYKETVDSSNGIWIGSGLYDQSLFKVSRPPAEAKEQLDNNTGFIINKTTARMAKYMEGDNSGK